MRSYCVKWRITANVDKCAVTVIKGKGQPKQQRTAAGTIAPIPWGHQQIIKVPSFKYIGVHLTNKGLRTTHMGL